MSASVNAHETADPTAPSGESRAAAGDETVPEIEVHRHHGVLVVKPVGQLDRDRVEQVRRTVLETDAPVAVDLDDCILIDPAAVARIDLGDDTDPGALCFVTRRLTCRVLLARSGIAARYAVFHQLEDALQAKVLADAGYGAGWSGQR